jgi:hypothetical protein
MLLRSEKANNKTLDFNKVYKVLEPYCFSYPLLVHNKSTMINLLMNFLTERDGNSVGTITAIQVTVLDLIIALIKDFR